MAENYEQEYYTTAEFANGPIPGGDGMENMGCTPANHDSPQQGAK